MRSTLRLFLSFVLVSANALPALAQVRFQAAPETGSYDLPSAPVADSGLEGSAAYEPLELLSAQSSLSGTESLSTSAQPRYQEQALHAGPNPRLSNAAAGEASLGRRLDSVGREIARPSAGAPAHALSSLFDRALYSAPEAPAVDEGESAAAAYEAERETKAAAAKTGKAESLSVVVPAHAARLREEVKKSDIGLLLLDYDDTLEGWAKPLSLAMGALLRSWMDAGVRVGIITDRPDQIPEGAKDVTIHMSLEGIPAEMKAGLLTGGGKGSRVREYQADGTAKMLEEEAPFSAEEKAAIEPAIDAMKAKHEFDRISATEYSYALILSNSMTALTPEEQQKAAEKVAADWSAELEARGYKTKVIGRIAKDPAKNPPYAAISKGKLDKKTGAERMMRLTGIADPKRVMVVGDSFFEPNKTDLDMANAAPGGLVFSVGGTMSPTVPRGFVYNVKGPVGTAELLAARAALAAGSQSSGREAKADEPKPFDKTAALRISDELRRLNRRDRNIHSLSEFLCFLGVIGCTAIIWAMFQNTMIGVGLCVAAVIGGLWGAVELDKVRARIQARIKGLEAERERLGEWPQPTHGKIAR